MTEHTHPPLRYEAVDDYHQWLLDDAGDYICELVTEDEENKCKSPDEAHATGQRLAACYNACEGLTNEQLAKYNLAAMPELVEAARTTQDADEAMQLIYTPTGGCNYPARFEHLLRRNGVAVDSPPESLRGRARQRTRQAPANIEASQ